MTDNSDAMLCFGHIKLPYCWLFFYNITPCNVLLFTPDFKSFSDTGDIAYFNLWSRNV